jgi:hypothetical protein
MKVSQSWRALDCSSLTISIRTIPDRRLRNTGAVFPLTATTYIWSINRKGTSSGPLKLRSRTHLSHLSTQPSSALITFDRKTG